MQQRSASSPSRAVNILIFIFCLLTVSVAAQDVDEIVARNIEALGGLANLKSVQSIESVGMISLQGIIAPLTMRIKRPGKLRMDLAIQGQSLVQATDGETAWQIMPFMGSTIPRKLSDDQAAAMSESADIDGLLTDYKQKGHAVELIGKEDVEGREAYHLKVTKQSGHIIDVYLDTERYLEMKRIAGTVVEGMKIKVTTYYEDYRLVEGLQMPYSMRVEAPERPAFNQVMKLTEIRLNPEIKDTIFEMPSEQPGPSAQ